MIGPVPACRSCELIARRDAGTAPVWDAVTRTAHWDVAHAHDTSLPGWTVLVVPRHVEAVAELTEREAAELGPLIRTVSRALRTVTGCVKTYVARFAEHPQHPHVHVHVIPRAADLPAQSRGRRIFEHLGVSPADQVPDAERDAIALRLRAELVTGA